MKVTAKEVAMYVGLFLVISPVGYGLSIAEVVMNWISYWLMTR